TQRGCCSVGSVFGVPLRSERSTSSNEPRFLITSSLVGPGGLGPRSYAQVFGVLVVLVDDRGEVGVVDRVFLEERVLVPLVAVHDVVDEPTEERDVRAGADRHVEVRDRAGA